jgi:hypothetical protein
MNIKLGHASIMDEKISSFARAIVEILNFFYFGCVTYGPPCIVIFLCGNEDFLVEHMVKKAQGLVE